MHHIPVARLAVQLGAESLQRYMCRRRTRLLVLRLFLGLLLGVQGAEVEVDLVGRGGFGVASPEVEVDVDVVLFGRGVAAEVDVKVAVGPAPGWMRTGRRFPAAPQPAAAHRLKRCRARGYLRYLGKAVVIS